jgi:hypothetical protein
MADHVNPYKRALLETNLTLDSLAVRMPIGPTSQELIEGTERMEIQGVLCHQHINRMGRRIMSPGLS